MGVIGYQFAGQGPTPSAEARVECACRLLPRGSAGQGEEGTEPFTSWDDDVKVGSLGIKSIFSLGSCGSEISEGIQRGEGVSAENMPPQASSRENF